jgi:formylmethanofuran dehydrogenase subunit B
MTKDHVTEHVTCLGCGCGCDDIVVRVSDGRIVDLTPTCPIGRAWFGDGVVPSEVRLDGRHADLQATITAAAAALAASAGRCLIYLGLDLTSEAQRRALHLADLLRATVDSPTTATAAEGLLAAQRRGRAAATLGEIRNRGDVVVFWGVDPAERYPRYTTRYALHPDGTHVGGDHGGRTVIGVSIGRDRCMEAADLTLDLQPDEEVPALSLMRAALLGQRLSSASPNLSQAVELADRLSHARYAVLVHDAESGGAERDPLRAEALIALAQALNTSTRAALSSLRGGGNRVGAEAVLTAQAGYPFAVDYSRGFPRYLPQRRGALTGLEASSYETVLILGSVPEAWTSNGQSKDTFLLIVGPRASQSSLRPRIAIDTGVAGIHETGTAYRMDEVPLQLRPPLPNPRSATEVITALTTATIGRLRGEQ